MTTEEPKTIDEAVRVVADEMVELFLRKHKDYGPYNILNSPAGAEKGIVVRLGDKINRLWNLLDKNSDPQNEPIEDSWSDIAVYGMISIMARRGWFELPFEEEEKPNSVQSWTGY